METFTPVSEQIGGLLIGLAASLLLLNGRISGISDIIGGLLAPKSPDAGWRIAFVAGLLLGAFAYALATVCAASRASRSILSRPRRYSSAWLC